MVQYIERDGIKYPYPVDADGRKTLHPDAVTDQQKQMWNDLVSRCERVKLPETNPFVIQIAPQIDEE